MLPLQVDLWTSPFSPGVCLPPDMPSITPWLGTTHPRGEAKTAASTLSCCRISTECRTQIVRPRLSAQYQRPRQIRLNITTQQQRRRFIQPVLQLWLTGTEGYDGREMSPNSQESATFSTSLAEVRYHGAVDSLAAGDLPTAIAGFRASLAADAEYVDAAHGLMHALKDAGQLDEAVLVARSLIAAHPDDILAHTSLSILYQRLGNIPEAEAAGMRAKLLGWKSQLREQKDAESQA